LLPFSQGVVQPIRRFYFGYKLIVIKTLSVAIFLYHNYRIVAFALKCKRVSVIIKDEVLFFFCVKQRLYPQNASIKTCALSIRKNIVSGYTVE